MDVHEKPDGSAPGGAHAPSVGPAGSSSAPDRKGRDTLDERICLPSTSATAGTTITLEQMLQAFDPARHGGEVLAGALMGVEVLPR